ncbi:MAG: DUF2892 domain-containing protein [Phycicoccus sp.]|nr:DUF2892 domain-containing protein [Phycicoccus sp.]
MNKNMGSADRKLRAFVAAPVLAIAGVLTGPATGLAFVLYGLAVVMLATSAVGTCPLYLPFRWNTGASTSVTTSSAGHASAR